MHIGNTEFFKSTSAPSFIFRYLNISKIYSSENSSPIKFDWYVGYMWTFPGMEISMF